MLYSVEIPLQVPQGMQVRPDMGSIMQGALMEIIANDAAQELHTMQLRPYTQSIYYDHALRQGIWRLTAIHSYGYEEVIQPVLAQQSMYVKHRQAMLTLGKPLHVVQQTYEQLADQIFQPPHSPRGVDITFLTPTSFKHDNAYDMLPNIARYYGSLLAKWNEFATTISLAQEGLHEELAAHCRVTKLHIDSQPFGLEGIRVTGIVGTMRLQFWGNDMMRRLQGLLWAFAPFSGLGIKNAIGMGVIKTQLRQ